MLTHRFGPVVAASSAWLGHERAAVLAAVVALAVALLGRLTRSPRIQAGGPALGVTIGWGALAGGTAMLHGAVVQRLPFLPLAALAAALLAGAGGWRHGPAVAAAALLGGAAWWLAGAPHDGAALVATFPALVGTAVLAAGQYRGPAQGPWVAAAALAALWLALALARVPAPVAAIALVPLAACAGLACGAPGRSPALTLNVAALGAAASLILGVGELHLHAGRADAAALAPLAVVNLAPWLGGRLTKAGAAVPVMLATLLAVAGAWLLGEALVRL